MGAIVYALVGLIEFALIFRFVFLLFGVQSSVPGVGFIYNATDPLVLPFAGIFGEKRVDTGTGGTGDFEIAALIALVVYGLIGSIVLRVLNNRAPT